MADEGEIRALVETWARAIRDLDMDGILANHTADVLMYDVVPPMQIRGMAEYQKSWELFFQYSPGGDGSFDLIDLQITAGDTAGYGTALVRVVDTEVRLTLGFRKVDGRWLIAHEHHSAPGEIEGE